MHLKTALKTGVALVIGTLAASSYATTYYVSAAGNDANGGTAMATPWQSLAKVSALTTLQPGDKVLFRCGDTFPGQLVVPASGAAGSPIVFSYYNAGTSACVQPMLSGGPTGSSSFLAATILAQDKQYVEFNNLHVRNNNTAVSAAGTSNIYGILVANAAGGALSYFRFTNLLIDEVAPYAFSTTLDANYTSGIAIENTANSGTISDIVVSGSTFTNNGRFGAVFVDSSRNNGTGYNRANPIYSVQNVSVLNNTCTTNGGSCFMGQRVQNMLIQGNNIVNSGAKSPVNTSDAVNMQNRGSGAWVVGCNHVAVEHNFVSGSYGVGDSSNIHVDGGNTDVVIEYNSYVNNYGAGLEVLGGNTHVIYRFNYGVNDGRRTGDVIWTDPQIPATVGGGSAASTDIWIYNNAFISNMSSPAFSPYGTQLTITLNSGTTYLYNNIFAGFGHAGIGTLKQTAVGGAMPVWNSNMFLSPGTDPSVYVNDQTKVLGDPKFVNETATAFTAAVTDPTSYTNFKLLQGSPALFSAFMGYTQPQFNASGQGIFSSIPATAVNGFFGAPITQASWDIGPYQWTGE